MTDVLFAGICMIKGTSIGVERCMKGKVGAKTPTHTLFLTFSKPDLPKELSIGYLKVKVSLYVRDPLQCYNCFKFGHPKHKCKATKVVCGKCGYDAHEGSCPHPPKCSNCKGDHPPTSKKCPTFVYNKNIKTLMAENKIGFNEAKKLVEASEGSAPQKGKSFADAAASGIGPKKPARNNTVALADWQICRITQFGSPLPEAIRAEALAMARKLRDELKTTKDASAQFSAEEQPAEKEQAPKRTKKRARRQPQAKPGGPPAPAPKATGANQAHRPATASASKPAVTKQANGPATSNSQAKPGKAPAAVPKPAGAKQAGEPKKSPPQTDLGDASATASKPAEADQAKEPQHPPSTETVLPADPSDTAGEESPSGAASTTSGEMEVEPSAQAEGGSEESGSALAPGTPSFEQQAKEACGDGFSFGHASSDKKRFRKKNTPQSGRLQKAERSPLYRSPFEEPLEYTDSLGKGTPKSKGK